MRTLLRSAAHRSFAHSPTAPRRVANPRPEPVLTAGHLRAGSMTRLPPGRSVASEDDPPLVSVITPTWRRHDLLLERCIPSVEAQDYPLLEHVVVSDGPDPELAAALAQGRHPRVRFSQLAQHDPASHYGHRARMAGIDIAKADIIAYLDDDDSWRPHHLTVLVKALLETGAPWAYSRCIVHLASGEVRVGDGPPAHGRIVPTVTMIHRRTILERQSWVDEPGAPDWELVRRWLDAGLPPVSVDEVTADYYPGSSFDAENKIPSALRPWRPS